MGVYIYRAKLKPTQLPEGKTTSDMYEENDNFIVVETIYPEFNRTLLTEEKGYFLKESDGYIYSISYSSHNRVRSMLADCFNVEECYANDQPLNLIIYFSDCEGYLGPNATKIMSDFLLLPKNVKKFEKYISKFVDDDWSAGCLSALVSGIIEAGKNGEYLIFS